MVHWFVEGEEYIFGDKKPRLLFFINQKEKKPFFIIFIQFLTLEMFIMI